MKWFEIMSKSSSSGVFLYIILCLTVIIIIPAYAEVTVDAKSFSFEETTIIEFTNIGNVDISAFRIWLGSDNNFKAFKTENGWIGEKTPQGVIIFTSSSEVIKQGESIKIGIKTDKISSGVNWKALDKSDQQIEIGKTISSELPKPEPKSDSTISEGGVLENSIFRIIPEKPNAGSTIRITGDNFGKSQELDFFINSGKISSFVTNDVGYFMTTVKIPENVVEDRVDFIIKDKENQEKKISLRLGVVNNRILPSDSISLTISGIPQILHRADFLEIFGTAQPNSSITASIKDPEGKIINTRTAKSDSKGNWKVAEPIIVPLDAPFGRYSAIISDGREEISTSWTIQTSKVILIEPITLKFNPGEIMKFNGTALPNKSLELILQDPLGDERFSDIIEVNATGNVELAYPTIANVDKEGTWTLIAEQDGKREFIYAGLGQIPSIPINIEFDKLNYKSTETATISLTGKPADRLTLLIIDPSDKAKIIENQTTVFITLGQDGKKTYNLNLSGYSSGVYTAVVNKGSSKSSEVFTVGLQTGSGDIKISSTKLEYRPGESILVLGDTKENSLLTLSLIGPHGTVWKTKEIFSDKKGKIADDSLRLPSSAESGIWKVYAKSGSNFANTEFEVITSKEKGLVVTVEQGGQIPGFDKSINIKVVNAVHTVVIQIINSEGKKIMDTSFPSSKTGEIKQPWGIPKDTAPGTYTIKVTDAYNTAETTFTIK